MTAMPFNWQEFLVLSAAGVFGVVAVIPYTLTLQGLSLRKAPIALQVLIPLQVIRSAILIAIAVAIGLLLGTRTGLAPLIEGWLAGEKVGQDLKAILGPSIILGTIVTLVIIILEVAIFAPSVPKGLRDGPRVSVWQAVLASFYGGITEELLTRLGILTMVAWLLGKISHTPQGLPSEAAMYTAIILAAIIFGLGHLPATAALAPLTRVVVIRALALNGLAGLVFGYLYWTWGLESAMLAHFTADIVLHVIVPFFNKAMP